MVSETYDLAIVGGGVIGLAHAFVAARKGKRVAVIERDVRANGASIRNFGFITVTGQERGESWALARRTRDIWAEVATQASIRIEHKGLYLTVRSQEALAVIEAFLATEMGDGCKLVSPGDFRRATGGLGSEDLAGALYSPHELRVESRQAIPLLSAWLAERHGVVFFNGTVANAVAPPRIETSRGPIEAGAVVVCPGDNFVSLYPDRIAAYGLQRCRLSMLRLASPGWRLPAGLMSDLSLVRYKGYAELPEAKALAARLHAQQPRHLENGVHLIVVQSADGSLVIGDSHHYDALPTPFAPASAEEDILDEWRRATGLKPPQVIERWTGTYAVAGNRTWLVDAPSADTRIVIVTSGTGASTCFGIAERVLGDLFGEQ